MNVRSRLAYQTTYRVQWMQFDSGPMGYTRDLRPKCVDKGYLRRGDDTAVGEQRTTDLIVYEVDASLTKNHSYLPLSDTQST